MLHVDSAKYHSGYIIAVDFEKVIFNDSRAIVSALRDLEVFKDFSIQNHTISWASGLDFAPEFIKECSIKILGDSA